MTLYKPCYVLSSDHKWLLKFRNDKKVIDRLRKRAIKAFEQSILEENVFDDRAIRISVEIIERFWAVRYPECIDTPIIQVYDLKRRGRFGINSNHIGLLTRFDEKFEVPKLKANQVYWFDKDIIEQYCS